MIICMRICAYRIKTTLKMKAMHDLIKAMKALSDETRLRIMRILLEKECCVCEVMQALNISQTRASRNLGILQDAGFLRARRDRFWTVYYIDWQATNNYTDSMVRLIKDSSINDKALEEDSDRLKHARRIGPGCNKKNTGRNS